MHGRPFSQYDGRELWRRYDYRSVGINCEAYLDVDWRKTCYFTDTAREWNSRHNVRDFSTNAQALCSPSFSDTQGLIAFLSENECSAVVSTHPERWTNSHMGWLQVVATDRAGRIVKGMLAHLRQRVENRKN
jgi:hypothetical protein